MLIYAFDASRKDPPPWDPLASSPDSSEVVVSFVFAAQKVANQPIPLVNTGGAPDASSASGLVLRPQAARLLCGKPVDSMGGCAVGPCSSGSITVEWSESADKFCSWRPGAEFVTQLQRLTDWQVRWKRLWSPRVLINVDDWRGALPEIVEAFFGSRSAHERFLDYYGLTADTHPRVTFDATNWGAPFGSTDDAHAA